MSDAIAINRDFDQEGFKWRPMLALSLVVHALLLSAIVWGPGINTGSLSMNEVVYEVDLVDSSKTSMPKETSASQKTATDNRQAKRISTTSNQKKAVTVAKRTVKRNNKPKKAEAPSSQLLDKAISKIEKKVKTEDNADYLDKAIAALNRKVGPAGGGTPAGGSVALRMYQMEVETWIKSHWSYPDAIGNQKNIEAVILLKVTQDGTVLEFNFIKPSRNTIFDQSVVKAIEKAKPLPPLPEGYEKKYEEIEINFNLKDFE